MQINNERIPHSCSGIYIFPAAERDGSPSQLGDSFREAPHLSCSGGRGRWRSVIMDVPGLGSDWSRLTLSPDGAGYGNFPGRPCWLAERAAPKTPCSVADSGSFPISVSRSRNESFQGSCSREGPLTCSKLDRKSEQSVFSVLQQAGTRRPWLSVLPCPEATGGLPGAEQGGAGAVRPQLVHCARREQRRALRAYGSFASPRGCRFSFAAGD